MTDLRRTGRNLNRTMATMPYTAKRVVITLPQSCSQCETPMPLKWVKAKDSHTCSCANGHVYAYPSLRPLGGV
jgi:hypothetical protein